MRARRFRDYRAQQATVQAIRHIADVQPGYRTLALAQNRIQTAHRNVPIAQGYGQMEDTGTEMSPAAALALGIGGLVLTGLLVIGGYMLVGYSVGWAATKGVQRAKRKKR